MSGVFVVFIFICLYTVLGADVTMVSVSNGTAAQKLNQTTTNKTFNVSTNAQHATASVVDSTSRAPEKPSTGQELETNVILKSEDPKAVPVIGKAIIAEVNTSVVLTCSLLSNHTLWHQNDNLISIKDETMYSILEENNTMVVRKVGPDCSEEYQCSNGTHKETFTIWVKPYVFQPDKKSKNVIEGDPFVMECKSWGFPSVTVAWFKDGEALEANERVTFKHGHSENSTLRIENVKYEDAGKYNCTGENEFGTASMMMEVQVKDKLAALWPFLGICAEVAILCTIIFVYEKRRSKRLEAEERREDERREEMERLNEGKDEKVPDELRQRKN